MLKDITLGQFFPGTSCLHRLDPRTKIVGLIALIALLFTAKYFTGLAFIALTVLVLGRVSGISARFVLKGLKPVVFIVAFTFLINLFFSGTGETLVDLGFAKITDTGLRTGCFMAARLMLLVVTSQLLTLTTSPISLTDGLESLMSPLKKLRFPVHELSMMMSIALRFIPTLLEEAQKIMNAQTARGADFETGSIVKKAKAMVPLLVPLFVSAFRRADELAQAMEARCYRGGEGRTRMHTLRFGRIDAAAFAVLAGIACAVVLLNTFIAL